MSKPVNLSGEKWTFRRFMGTDESIAQALQFGIQPVPMLDNDGSAYVIDNNGRVALVAPTIKPKRGEGHKLVDEVRDARGHLIAAAPDMLEACKKCAEYLDLVKQNYPDLPGLISGMSAARAAIAKAEGK